MTFSDSRVAKLLESEFVPVWESVSPVRVVTFDLGEGRSFTGTANGEIAIYFCSPDGKVFDILPALQSPAVTLAAMKEALGFYNRSKLGGLSKEEIRLYHRQRMEKLAAERYQALVNAGEAPKMLLDKDVSKLEAEHLYPESKKGEIKRDKYINMAVDSATRDMRVMMLSKVVSLGLSEEGRVFGDAMTVVEPGGKGYFQWQVDRAFLGVIPDSYSDLYLKRQEAAAKKAAEEKNETYEPVYSPWVLVPLDTPDQWKEMLFEHILKQELKGGKVKYNSDSLEAINLIEE